MFKAQKNTSFGIIGLGRFGTALALKLIEAGCEVIVVDRNENKVKAIFLLIGGAARLYH